MNRESLRRGCLVALVLLGALIAQTAVSRAQLVGSELTGEVPPDLVGIGASIQVADVSAFPPTGAAVFEPGTANEEAFTYTSVNTSSNLLVGLTRPDPVAHVAGTFVQAPVVATETPASHPLSPVTTPPPSPAGESSASGTVDEAPDPCYEVTGKTCTDTVTDGLGTTGCEDISGKSCEDTVLGPINSDDPCDPDNTGQTCEEKILGLVSSTETCDPDNIGQTCEELIDDELNSACATLTEQWQESCFDVGEQIAPECLVADQPLMECIEGLRQRLMQAFAVRIDPPPTSSSSLIAVTTGGGGGTGTVTCSQSIHASWPPGPGPKFLIFGAGIACVGPLPPAIVANGGARLDVHIEQPNDPDNSTFVIHDHTLPYFCLHCNNNSAATAKPHPVFNRIRYQIVHEFSLTAAGGIWLGTDHRCFGWGTPELACQISQEIQITKAGSG